MTAIPAITIWQPWASLIMAGHKPYEFRAWAAPRRYQGQRIGIHAGARPVRKAEVADLICRLRSAEQAWTVSLRREALDLLDRVHAQPTSLPLSHMLGTAILGVPVRAPDLIEEFGGVRNDSDRDEHFNWGWPLTDIQHLEPPEPARGAQGFWKWTPGAQP